MMIYIIIAAVIILLIYIALKRDAQIKELNDSHLKINT